MFEHLRAALHGELAAAAAAVTAAEAGRGAAVADLARRQGELPDLQAAVATAAATADAASQRVAAAAAVLDQRTADLLRAQALLDAAETALAAHQDLEPPKLLPNGKVNPEWPKWNLARALLQKKLADASTTRDAAAAQVSQAAQARDAAVADLGAAGAALDQARSRLTAAEAGIVAAQQQVAVADQAVTDARQASAAVAARLAGLDGRAAALVAEPLDRPGLEVAADAELADLLAAWRRRHEVLTRRVAAVAGRGAVLAAVDSTVDDVAALRAGLAAWPQRGDWPALPALLAALDAVIAANAAERTRPPLARHDDLAALRGALATQAAALAVAVGQAGQARDRAAAAVRLSSQRLAQHQRAI